MENGAYLLAAFVLVWALVFGYIVVLLRRQRRLRQELDILDAASRKEPPGQ